MNDAERYIARLNELLGHLRASGVPAPDDFELTDADRTTLYVKGAGIEGIDDDAYDRLRSLSTFLRRRGGLITEWSAAMAGVD
jgi:hypothetical protein